MLLLCQQNEDFQLHTMHDDIKRSA